MDVKNGEHPYSPPDAPIPLYLPNESPSWLLIGKFFTLIIILEFGVLRLNRMLRPQSNGDKFALSWFFLCGLLHCVFEGYWLLHHDQVAGMQGLFAQLWKEYALSDSRYLTSDPVILSAEGLTALLLGPLSLSMVWFIVTDSPMRHPMQMIVCTGHLMSVMLYFCSSLIVLYLNDISHSRPEYLYSLVYFYGFNLPWIVIPFVLLLDSVIRIRDAMAVLVRKEVVNGVSFTGEKKVQ